MAVDQETVDYEAVGYLAASDYRTSVLQTLADDPSIPSDIASETNLQIQHVSRCLTELRDRDLIELLVPEAQKKGRIYAITDDGQAAIDGYQEITRGGDSR